MKDIIGYEGRYSADENGRIFSHITNKYLKQYFNVGYYKITLRKNGKPKTFYVHRLIAETYLGKRENMIVNHIDGDRTNNHVSNLEWISQSENVIHAIKIGLMCVPKGEEHYNSKLTQEDVNEIRKQYNNGIKQNVLAKTYKVSTVQIHNIIRYKSWS